MIICSLCPIISLNRPPALARTQFVSYSKGEFYNRKNHSEPPFVSQPFTLALQPGYMLSLGLSEFTLNSAMYGYFSAGLLQILVNDSMVSPPLDRWHAEHQEFGQESLTARSVNLHWNIQLRLRNVVFLNQIPPFVHLHLNTSEMGPFVPQVRISVSDNTHFYHNQVTIS